MLLTLTINYQLSTINYHNGVHNLFYKLLLIFIIVPLIELALLIQVGGYIGVLPTVLLVGFTGALGISLAKLQGLAIIGRTKLMLARGKMPSDSLLDGVLVLMGAAMLLTPGLLTDIAGFSLILSGPREKIRAIIKNKFKGKIINIYHNSKNKYSEKKNNKSYDDDDDVIDIGESKDD